MQNRVSTSLLIRSGYFLYMFKWYCYSFKKYSDMLSILMNLGTERANSILMNLAIVIQLTCDGTKWC